MAKFHYRYYDLVYDPVCDQILSREKFTDWSAIFFAQNVVADRVTVMDFGLNIVPSYTKYQYVNSKSSLFFSQTCKNI